MTSVSLEFENNDLLPALFGESNENLKTLENRLGVVISGRGNLLHLQGPKDAVAAAERFTGSYQKDHKDQKEDDQPAFSHTGGVCPRD
mgnify:CR=1 FL=1